MLTLGWFSTGRGEGSLGLLRIVQDAIRSHELSANIQFVFSNREIGEADGSDRFFEQVNSYGISLFTFSSQRFRREHGGGPFSMHRIAYDREVLRLLENHQPDVCVLAGYMLIADAALCNRYNMLNLHPSLPGGPIGTWQEVIWNTIENRSKKTGAYIHLATEDLDRGPVLTYCSFDLMGNEFDPLWNQIEGRSLDMLKAVEGENLPLFQLIRQEGLKRERPLLLATLNAFADGNIHLDGQQLVDFHGDTTGVICLNEAVQGYL